MDNYFEQNRQIVCVFAIIASFLVLVGALVLIFVDDVSNLLGLLVLKMSFGKNNNQYPLGKIAGFGLLPFTPLLLIYTLEFLFGEEHRTAFFITAGIMAVGLVVLFYIVTVDYFDSIVTDGNWFFDLAQLYIWYAFPVLSWFLIYGFRIMEFKLQAHVGWYILITVLLVPFMLIAYPALLAIIGILIGAAIEILIVIFIFKVIKSMAEGSGGGSSNETIYELDDGTKVKHDYGDYYKDENGNRWTSDDGNTFYKD